MIIRMQLDNAQETIESLQKKGEQVSEAVTTQMNRSLLQLQRHIIREHLSAPPGPSKTMLHQRTGKLIQSIRIAQAQQTADGIEGEVQAGGGPAWYARQHEYGGSWTIPAHEAVRRIFKKGKIIGATTFSVKEHAVNMPERSFMRASLAEMKDTIVAAMTEAVKDVIEK